MTEHAPPAAKAAEAKPKKPRKSASRKKKKETKAVVARGKRKECVARARIVAGKGDVRFNRMAVRAISNRYIRNLVSEPLRYLGPEADTISVVVDAHGGGAMGQAQAARTAIARGLVAYFENEELKKKFMAIDRSLLIEDSRRVESKKYKGPKARARYQKSYR